MNFTKWHRQEICVVINTEREEASTLTYMDLVGSAQTHSHGFCVWMMTQGKLLRLFIRSVGREKAQEAKDLPELSRWFRFFSKSDCGQFEKCYPWNKPITFQIKLSFMKSSTIDWNKLSTIISGLFVSCLMKNIVSVNVVKFYDYHVK